MRLLNVFDDKNYEDCKIEHNRYAVRAIIIKDNKLAFTVSSKEGFVKFPGGGINENENYIDALIRETKEETGLLIKKDSIKEYGMTIERRKDAFSKDAVFNQTSYYYFASVSDEIYDTNLDEYEKELGFHLGWIPLEEAYKKDFEFGNKTIYDYIKRETYVLSLLMKENVV